MKVNPFRISGTGFLLVEQVMVVFFLSGKCVIQIEYFFKPCAERLLQYNFCRKNEQYKSTGYFPGFANRYCACRMRAKCTVQKRGCQGTCKSVCRSASIKKQYYASHTFFSTE